MSVTTAISSGTPIHALCNTYGSGFAFPMELDFEPVREQQVRNGIKIPNSVGTRP